MVQIPYNLDSLLLGVIISDGHLRINKAGNTLLSFKQSLHNFEFFYLCLINLLIIAVHILFWKKKNKKQLLILLIEKKKHVTIRFVTRVFPCFTKWYEIFI